MRSLLDTIGRRLDRIGRRLPGGPEGNRRLTALTGALLALGILAELGTLMLGLQRTLSWHVLIGIGLIPLVLVKLSSTGWRMVRYYTHNPDYRAEGPPRTLLRLLAPVLVGATLAVLASGVGLVAFPQVHFFRALHGASFAVFLLTVGVHGFAHLPKLRRFAFADWLAPRRGHALRQGLVAFALVTGLSAGVAVMISLGPLLPLLARDHGQG